MYTECGRYASWFIVEISKRWRQDVVVGVEENI
jgi:hypothetical protein